MKRKNGISIVMITFNRAKDLEKTIGILRTSNYICPMEILVVDQNSSDGTEEVCKRNSREFSNLKYYHLNENLGVAGGRNFGASKASYEYLIFLDDDANFVDGNAFAQIYNLMNEESEYALFAFQVKNLEGGYYNWPYGDEKKKKANEVFEGKFFIGCAHAIKASWFEQVGGYSSQLFFWGEETELVLKSIAHGGKGVYYDGSIIALHRVHGNGRVMDGDRFYYQVRNRMYLIKELYPRGIKVLFNIYYCIGYLLKALKHKWMQNLKKGIHDFRMMKCPENCELTWKQFLVYMKL